MVIEFLFSYSGVVISILCFLLVSYLARDLEMDPLQEKEEDSLIPRSAEISDGY